MSQFEDKGGGESEQSNKDKIIRYQWEFQDLLKSQTYRLYTKKKKRRNRVWGEEEEFYSESIEIFFRRIKKFPRVRKRMLLHIQEAFKTSIKQDQKRISLRIIIKTQNTQNKAGILKVAEASPSQRHQVILLML